MHVLFPSVSFTQKRKSRLFSVLAIVALLAASSPAPARAAESSLGDAVAVWHLADLKDAAGKDSCLTRQGDAQVGVALAGAEQTASLVRGGDGRVAELAGGYLLAGQGAGGELNLTGKAMTLCVRVRAPGGTWGGTIFSKHGGHRKLVYNLFSREKDSRVAFELGSDEVAGMHQVQTKLDDVGPDKWHDVVVRFDRQFLQLFVDGNLRDQETAVSTLREGNTEPCLIGAEAHGGKVRTQVAFRGLVDHVALWDRALSDAEIARLSGVKQVGDTRPKYYHEKYRPQFHFTARKHWINDPNGLVYYKGTYHLFFQHRPPGRPGAYKDWGHAVSTDLVHWRELPAAGLTPHDTWGGCWSGSAVVDHQNTTGFQTGDETPIIAIPTLGGPARGAKNTQCLAYSLDGGKRFKYYQHNPVLGHIVAQNRDPKVVWYAPTKKWIMALYMDKNDFMLFSSPDMKTWRRIQTITFPGAAECPDFFQLAVDGDAKNKKWVLWAANGTYLIGSFDGNEFTAESKLLKADHGANFYAAQTFSDIPESDVRCVQIAWMRGGRYPGMPFTQQQSFACVLTLRTTPEGVRMFREPVEEIKNIRGQQRNWSGLALKPGDNPLSGILGDLLEIQAEIELGDAKHVGLDIRGHKVQYDVAKNQVTCLRRTGSLTPKAGRFTLHVLVDRTSVEVFGNDGRLSMTSCFLPADDNLGLGVYASGGTAKIVSLKVWELRSIWPK